MRRRDVTELLNHVLSSASAAFGHDVAPTDNFFALGGDSLRAVELLVALEAKLGTEVDPALLLDADNFLSLADRLAGLA